MQEALTQMFIAHRPRLIGLVYRLTSSVSEAEDIVQETFVRWMQANHQGIQSPFSWLATVATRLALDYLKSARVKRESYIGPWLPEPLLMHENTPEREQALDESLSMALLMVLEQLSPGERAAFILHDVFQLSFNEIATTLNRKAASCRKLASRARTKIGKSPNQYCPPVGDHRKLVSAFFEAIKTGDMQRLQSLLREDVTLHVDGGGKVPAALTVLQRRQTVIPFLLRVLTPGFSAVGSPQVQMTLTWFNGAPGFVIWVDAQAVSAFNLDIQDQQIRQIHVLRNPDKLRFFKSAIQQNT